MSLLLLAACQNVGADVEATLAAGDDVLLTEAARMQAEGRERASEAAGTVSAAGTRIAELDSVSSQLFLTLSAGSTPTVSLIVGQAPISSSSELMDDTGDGSRLFTQSGVATAVSSQNGCVMNPSSNFNRDAIQQLYATAMVINEFDPLNMRAEWYYENQLITEASWTMTPTTSPYCFWAVIDRNDTDFPPGNYTVQMYLDQFALRDLTMSFQINE